LRFVTVGTDIMGLHNYMIRTLRFLYNCLEPLIVGNDIRYYP